MQLEPFSRRPDTGLICQPTDPLLPTTTTSHREPAQSLQCDVMGSPNPCNVTSWDALRMLKCAGSVWQSGFSTQPLQLHTAADRWQAAPRHARARHVQLSPISERVWPCWLSALQSTQAYGSKAFEQLKCTLKLSGPVSQSGFSTRSLQLHTAADRW